MDFSTETQWTVDGFAIVEQTRAGVRRAKVDELACPVGLTDREMTRILNISERTLHRLRPDAHLDCNASERLLLLEVLLKHRLDVFDGRADVLGRCSNDSLLELRQQAPVKLLDTETVFSLVHTVLGRIKHGVYA
ncbi:antitoxin Xre-like helix-turn-helix domain-containing protein [Spirosoma foliorum]|uniref:Antitoxin Xre-like helix-turn-helix domain-containing protein n=1 Tax=Spirosoma foliorum TaxID=2710596 RepID=A0A7G5H6M8_9BACT|nr:antitoxin Xre-like helix-turn-helix domain-containing protein [Spirosoma foliorum]QMW06770.1 hypothetical protein H3H32_18690 [Spirosoma foliorum]